jgi:hypothetical protein
VSLFGGKGRVLPGVLLGTLLQGVENSLVNAGPYLYPMVLASVDFLAAFLDSLQTRTRRHL